MNWNYYLPQIWDHNPEGWGDIYLLPDNETYDGNALWVTINALSAFEQSERRKILDQMGDRSFYIDEKSEEMNVRAESFTKTEFLEWARLWLEAQDLPVDCLLESSREVFKGKAYHADLMDELKDKLQQLNSQ